MSRARIRHTAWVAATVAVLFTAPALPAYADVPTPPADPLSAAQDEAVTGGQTVPVDALTTETYTVTANPDGSFTSTTNVMPVRVRKDGDWTAVDATLEANSDGSYSPAATPNGVTLSGGGNGPLVTLHHQDGTSMSLSVPFTLPAPTVTGDDAVYTAVLPGVDLAVTVTDQGGFSDVLVVHSAQAASDPRIRQLTLSASTDGLTLAATPSGGMEATAANGDLDYTTPAPLMWDSGSADAAASPVARTAGAATDVDAPDASSTEGPGPNAQVEQVPMTTTGSGLTLTPDPSVLTDPDTAYPLYIDPATNPVSDKTGHYDEVYSSSTCSDSPQYDKPQTNGEGVGYQGYGGACGNGIERSYYAINTGNLTPSMVVSKASIAVSTTYAASWDCSRNQPITLHTTSSITKDTDWQSKPSVLDSTFPAVSTHVASGANSNSSCSNHTADFNVTSQAQRITDGSHDVWTIGLFGAENSDDDADYLRMSTAFVLTVTFDIPPSVPTSLHTVPTAAGATAGCPTSGDGWFGDVTTTGGSSNVKLAATVTSNVSGETVAAHFHVWDRTVQDSTGATQDVSKPVTGLLASGTATTIPIGFVLKDGHEYGWDVYAQDKVGLTSAISDHCWFKTDFTPPQTPVVAANPSFPRVGSGSPDPVVYADASTTATFAVTGSDSPSSDHSCTPNACLSSGVAHFLWSLDSQPTTSSHTASVTSTTGGVASGSVTVPLTNWGVHTLYVAAVDGAGNMSQAPSSYTFVVPWDPNKAVQPGDITGDGTPDLLATTKTGDLEVLPGDTDQAQDPAPAQTGPVAGSTPAHVTGPAIVSTAAETPGGGDWTHYLLAHRGNLHGADGDDLFAYDKDTHQLYLVKNDLDPVSDTDVAPWSAYPGYIDQGADRNSLLTKPACETVEHEPVEAHCRATDYGTTTPITQLAVAGNVFHNVQGNPALITVENKELWIYQTSGGGLTDPTLLGDGDWSGMTLLTPGEVNGTATLWARDNTTGDLYSYSLATDPDTGAPPLLHAATRTALSVTLPPASYPYVASPGDINSSSADGKPDGCPDLYTANTKGQLIEYPSSSSDGTCSGGLGTAVNLGTITDTATHAWHLNDGTGTTAADNDGALPATLNGNATWATDSTRGKVLSLTGTTGYAATNGPAVDTSKSYTVSAWVKLSSLTTNSTFVSQTDATDNANALQLYYSSGNQVWAFNRRDDDGTTGNAFTPVYSTTHATTGKWTHLVGVYDATGKTLTLYVNGSLAAKSAYNGQAWNATGPLQIGRRISQGTYGEYADAQISDVRLYNTALPLADAVSIGTTPKLAGLS